jgi:bacteriocin biosynthesis cyclodehydratase domain-containing protein
MTRFPSPDPVRVLVVGAGTIAIRLLCLLTESDSEVTTLSTELDEIDLGGFSAVALASERPLPVWEAALDEAARLNGTPWTSALLLAHRFRVGPAVVPGRTPCHECWRRRVRSRAPDLAVYDAIQNLARKSEQAAWFNGALAPLQEQVAALLAAEVISLANRSYPFPAGALGRYWEGDAVHGHLQAHVFAAVGSCPRCVSAEAGPGRSPELGRFVRERFATAVDTDARSEK